MSGRGRRVINPVWAWAVVVQLFAGAALAQGFAGLGTDAEGFAQPSPDTRLDFPTDHGPHDDFRIEWWYVTANLTGPDGTPYGAQWTLFRSALTPAPQGDGWNRAEAWMGHAALSTPVAHFFDERLVRGGVGIAGVTADPFAAWIDEWQLGGDTFDRLTMQAGGADFAYDLSLVAEAPLVLHGRNGYSVKSPQGQASHYYSQPFFRVSGTILLPDADPLPVTGHAWLDREWSSQPLGATQTGWDWFSLHFETGDKLMAFRLHDSAGPSFSQATWIEADGTATAYGDGVLQFTPLEHATVAEATSFPVDWRIDMPERGLHVTVSALNPGTYMATSFPYWEGPVTIRGTHDGVGYLEMTAE